MPAGKLFCKILVRTSIGCVLVKDVPGRPVCRIRIMKLYYEVKTAAVDSDNFIKS